MNQITFPVPAEANLSANARDAAPPDPKRKHRRGPLESADPKMSPKQSSFLALPFVRLRSRKEMAEAKRLRKPRVSAINFWSPGPRPPGEYTMVMCLDDERRGAAYADLLIEHIQLHSDRHILNSVLLAISRQDEAQRQPHLLIGFIETLGRAVLRSTYAPRPTNPEVPL
ncbi:hypothetical protein [Roseococcus sp. YIM B11640]|uniref:hypothetical protein n=1 Tax=Roseococcus sp. YIM B11640 TaxID=3133973 RepID=UPI003C7BA9A0